ncbi:hypothetical protein BH09BAC1_BH09BAC1_11260 [soil metagenome]
MLVFELANFLENIFRFFFEAYSTQRNPINSGAVHLVSYYKDARWHLLFPEALKELPFFECYSQNRNAKMGLFRGKNQAYLQKDSQLIIPNA